MGKNTLNISFFCFLNGMQKKPLLKALLKIKCFQNILYRHRDQLLLCSLIH